MSCSDGATATLNSDTALTFDNTAGTATSGLIGITVKQSFTSCSYKATNAV
ncbi:hypothetical protein ACWGQ9_27770 [Streptomyces parvus]